MFIKRLFMARGRSKFELGLVSIIKFALTTFNSENYSFHLQFVCNLICICASNGNFENILLRPIWFC